jgi:hypothetical protein
MKKTACLFLLALVVGPGCWTLPFRSELAPSAVDQAPPKPRGPVLAEHIDASNAHRAADALSQELDRAEREGQP